jgi:mono/diheme cytochrome c family protein
MRKLTFALFLTFAGLLGLTLAATAAPAAAPAQTAGPAKDALAARAGQEVFNQRCFQCHSTVEAQVRVGPSLYHVMAKPHPRKTPAEVRTLLLNGKDKMPSFKGILTAADTDNLIAYLHTL